MTKLFGSAVRDKDVAPEEEAPVQSNAQRVSNIKDLVMEGRQNLSVFQEIKDSPLPLAEISSFELKEFLRERIGNLSIEGTINEMFTIIMSMEDQLKGVIDINSSLEKDLTGAQDALKNSGSEREQLKEKVVELEDTLPLRKELKQELEQLVEDHQKVLEEKQDIHRVNGEIEGKVDGLSSKITLLTEEKKDVLRENSYLQTNIDDLVVKVRQDEEKVNELNGELIYFQERIKKLEEELSDTVDERNAIELELKECKESFDEIYDALIETRVKTKKFFYQELKKES